MITFQAKKINNSGISKGQRPSSIVTRNAQHKPRTTIFAVNDYVQGEFLSDQGLSCFEDFWSLPQEFVDDINYRKGGWSGVSLLTLGDKGSERNYYVKRQENQLRYSFGKPFGALTFEHEAEAIERNKMLGLPAIDIACWGVRRESGSTKGLLVTADIGYCSLDQVLATQPYSPALGALLFRCGEQLLAMHKHGIQHGALYPKHIFVDQVNGTIRLIDFERARQKNTVRTAIRADLKQLIKHLKTSPPEVLEMLLGPYQSNYSKLLTQL